MSDEEPSDLAFAGRVEEIVEQVGGPAEFARQTGLSRTVLDKYRKGLADPSRLRLSNMARVANVSLEWLATGYGSKIPRGVPSLRDRDQQAWDNGAIHNKSPGEQREIDKLTDLNFVALPVIDIPASAGGGSVFYKNDEETWVKFERLYLKNNLNLNVDALFCMYCVGESMEPTIHSGELMIASREESYLKPGDGIYILRLDGHIIVKRMQIIPGNRVLISSDNPNYKPYEIPLDDGTDFKPLGKVVMVTGPRRV